MVCSTEGDLGDCVYCAGILSEIGGKHTLIIQKSEVTALRSIDSVNKMHKLLEPLLSIQPYIEEFRPEIPGDKFDWKSGMFRSGGFHFKEVSLLRSHVNHLIATKGVGKSIHGKMKWLTVEPSKESNGFVVVNRTFRYNNPYFPWTEIVSHYGDRILFIGLPHEHETFCSAFGQVAHRPTKDYLEVARLISGSDLFIGNQSSAGAISEGLKHTHIQETSLSIPDCIFKRGNVQHVWDGKCVLPDVSGSGNLELPSKVRDSFSAKTHITPPGNWVFRGITHSNFEVVVSSALRNYKDIETEEDARREVLRDNYLRLPDYFRDHSAKHIFDVFHKSMSLAQ